MTSIRFAAAWTVRQAASYARIAAVAASAALGAVPAWAQSRPADPGPAESTATPIEGFRQARFGMAEQELRQAIQRDFPTAARQLSRSTHPRERTTVLALKAEDLLPDTGPAQLSYILGYTSKRLVQVNITWVSDGRSTARDAAIVAAANILRDHLHTLYAAPPNVSVANQSLGGNAILVFRAAQPDGRMLLLLLSGIAASGRPAQNPSLPPLTLQLSYIRDPRSPDIFRIAPGRF